LVRKGLTEAEVEAAVGDLADRSTTSVLPAATIAALKLADALTEHGVPHVDPALMTELEANFDHGQILELGSALSVASGWQRFIEAFGIRPDHWTEATPEPHRPE
jgi:alkylhydroperoxidase family enzyme